MDHESLDWRKLASIRLQIQEQVSPIYRQGIIDVKLSWKEWDMICRTLFVMMAFSAHEEKKK